MERILRKVYWFTVISILILGIIGCGSPATHSGGDQINTNTDEQQYEREQNKQQEQLENPSLPQKTKDVEESLSSNIGGDSDGSTATLPSESGATDSRQKEPPSVKNDNNNKQPTANNEKAPATGTQPKIVFKSDNPITISSKEVLEQLDKEIEQLLKTLDNMDSILDEQLNF